MVNSVTIYALADLDGKVRYIGKTTQTISERMKGHWKEAKIEDHYRARWLRSLKENGIIPKEYVIEIVDSCEADSAEKKWIKHYRAFDGTRKLTNGTNGGDGVTFTPEIRDKISKANVNRACSPKALRALQKANENKVITPEARQKMSTGSKGIKHTPETCKKISDALKGKKPSIETRQKMSIAAKARCEKAKFDVSA